MITVNLSADELRTLNRAVVAFADGLRDDLARAEELAAELAKALHAEEASGEGVTPPVGGGGSDREADALGELTLTNAPRP